MEEEFPLYSEVQVVEFPERPELEGKLGAIVGTSEPSDRGMNPAYGVMLDDIDRVFVFVGEQLLPTGRLRRREDYY